MLNARHNKYKRVSRPVSLMQGSSTAMFSFRLGTTLLLATAAWLSVGSAERAITCENNNNVHRLSCDIGVISVTSARYGRADREICKEGRPRRQLTNTRCSQTGTTELVKRRCNNRKVCQLNKRDDFGTSDPCPGTFKYMETNFTCLPAIHTITCQGSLAYLYCDPGQVIRVYGANYGRHDLTTCSYRLTGTRTRNIYCSNPTDKVAEMCDGKNRCSITVLNSVLGNQCRGTYKYLELAYVCEYTHRP